MELSQFLAQLFGLTLVIFSVAGLVRPEVTVVAIRDLKPFSFATLMAGFIGIIGGLAIILSHNIWVADWRVIVTLFGWISLLKGITYLAFPEIIINTAVGVLRLKNTRIITLSLVFLLGAYLSFKGFGLGI